MKKLILSISVSLMICSTSFAVQPELTDLPFAYGEQLWISTFDGEWETDNNEPVNMPNGGGWHSFNTGSYGGVSGAARNRNQFNFSDETRPGSPENAKSARVSTVVTMNVPANGNATTGRIRADMTVLEALNPANAARNLTKMYNYTERADARFTTPFESKPDSVAVWVNFKLASNSTVVNQKGRISIFIHGDTDFRDVPATAALRNQVVAFAGKEFDPTDGWVRLSIPFQYDSFVSYVTFTGVTASSATQEYIISGNVEPKYIIATAATSHVPAVGTLGDTLRIDDFLMIYNPILRVENTSEKSKFIAGEEIKISYTITGTMSPYNLNAAANVVRLELSDAAGSFDNAVVLDEVTTNESGVFTVNFPEEMEIGSGYKLRVVTTNYPMISDEMSIEIYALPPTVEDITSPTAVCSGNNLTLTAPNVTTNGSTISSQAWEIETATGSGTFVTFNTPFTVTDADNGKSLRYIVVSNTGTVFSNAVAITVNPMPAAPTVVSPVIYVAGTIATPLTAIGSNLQWFEDNVTTTPLSGAPTPLTTAVTDSRSYWVSQTINGCESPRAELIVEIAPYPLPTMEDITPPTAVCSGNSLVLTTPNVTDNGSTISSQGWEIETAAGSGIFAAFNTPFAVIDADNGKLLRYAVAIDSEETVVFSNTVSITVNSVYSEMVDLTICENELPYTWRSNILPTGTTSGVLTFNEKTIHGCDSIVTLNLTVNPIVYGIDNQTACDSFTWIDGITYTASNNTATHIIFGGSAFGCDSIVTLNLTVNPIVYSIDNQTACDSFTWIDGITYTASNNTATHIILGGSAFGCDSIITLNLTVNPTPEAPEVTTVIYEVGTRATPLTAIGSNLQWFEDNITTTPLLDAPTPLTTAETDSRSYWVSQTVNDCESPRAELRVEITTNVQMAILRDSILILLNNISILQSEISGCENENNMLLDSISILLTENKTLQNENSMLQNENSTLQDENSILQDENNNLLSENSTLQNENSTLQDENSTLQDENSTLQDENSILQDENNNLLSENSTLQNENSTLQGENNNLQNENNVLHDSIGNLHQIIVEWIDIRNELSDSISWLHQLLENCEQVGLPVIPENQIQVFPNPVVHVLQVVVPNELIGQNTIAELYNVTGKLVFSKPLNPHINEFTIDMSLFEQGVYLLRIGNQTVKIIKS